MKLISHRGNVDGPRPKLENTKTYIDEAIRLGYDVEIDIWYVDCSLYLGHDEPNELVDLKWIERRKHKLWLHCKNIKALQFLSQFNHLHYFWHQEDDVTLTSFNFMWTYPGKEITNMSICVLPELNNHDVSGALGVCSDYIKKYKL